MTREYNGVDVRLYSGVLLCPCYHMTREYNGVDVRLYSGVDISVSLLYMTRQGITHALSGVSTGGGINKRAIPFYICIS